MQSVMSSELPDSQPPTKANSGAASGSPARRSYSGCMSGVDAKFKHLTDHVFPDSPYYLTVPTDRPFHLGNRFVSNWAVGKNTVFSPEEEHLQYMTFLTHQNEDTMLVAVGGWADEKGNIMQEQEEPVRPASASQNGGQQKKKITLSDYKKKAQQGPITKPEGDTPKAKKDDAVSPSDKEPAQPLEPGGQATNKSKKLESPFKPDEPVNQTSAKKPNGISECKDTPDNAVAPQKRKNSDQTEISTPKKKLRLSTDQQPKSDQSLEKNKKLPELLSPTLPPSIPRLLSPTLPSTLEEELAKFPEESSSSTDQRSGKKKPHSGSTSSASSKKVTVKTGSLDSETVPKAKNKDVKGSDSAQTVSQSASLPSARAPATKTPLPSSITKHPSRPGVPSKSRLLVKLKYGRQNRKRVEALLKFSGKRKPSIENPAAKQKSGTNATPSHPPKQSSVAGSKPVKQREPSSGYKRPKGPETDEPGEAASKRPRNSTTTSTSDRPRTPAIQVTKASPTTTSNKQFLTPNKDVKGVAMRRVGSGGSDTKNAASVSPQRGPGSAEKPARPSPQSTENHSDHRRAWYDEFQRLATLGRELKHASRRYTRTNATEDSRATADEKLGTATAVESILCFILAFIADDKFQSISRHISDSKNWCSITPYLQAVTKDAAPYPHLHGLCLFLGAVSQEAIHSLDLERLAVSAVPSEHSPAPTPGSDGNTVTSEESKKYKREFADLKSRLPESYRKANRLWIQGSRELSDGILAEQYPDTWSGRSKNFSNRGTEKTTVGKYSGEYFLPLGGATKPLEAVRFGLAFLEEWCANEGIKWKGKLVL